MGRWVRSLPPLPVRESPLDDHVGWGLLSDRLEEFFGAMLQELQTDLVGVGTAYDVRLDPSRRLRLLQAKPGRLPLVGYLASEDESPRAADVEKPRRGDTVFVPLRQARKAQFASVG